MKLILKNFLFYSRSDESKFKIKRFVHYLKSIPYRNNLYKLATIYGTDKGGDHFYIQHYLTHFKKFKNKKINLLEIGVGGYEEPFVGGPSLRMWKSYFKKANIFAIDIFDKSSLEERRIKIYKGSQTDNIILNRMATESKGFDIIIDDGSHINEHVIETFKILFKKLNDGGLYVVEDTCTSYWPGYGGDSNNLQNPTTMINFFKNFIDSINNQEFIKPGYEQSYYDKNIFSIHFYHNIIFIQKGLNNQGSPMLQNNNVPEGVNVFPK